MLWRIFSNVKCYKSSTYDGDIIAASELDLDPITVQPVQWERLLVSSKCLLLVASLFLSILRGDHLPVDFTKIPKQRHIPVISKHWRRHIEDLINWGLMQRTHGKSHIVSGYFAVAKPGDPPTARSIFAGGRLSRLCDAPPPVNLLELGEMMDMITMLDPRNFSAYIADLRHWFHQIQLCRKSKDPNLPPEPSPLRQLFQLVTKWGKHCRTYEWTRLPMGWSWSPAIAQAISWCLILHREEGDVSLFDESNIPQDALPRYVPLTTCRGFVHVTYDNIGVFADNFRETERIQQRIERNLEMFSATIKEGNVYGRKEFSLLMHEQKEKTDPGTHKLPKHLGMEFAVRSRGRNEIVVRVCEKKIAEWKNTKPIRVDSARGHATIVGRILWSNMVRGLPLVFIREVIDVARKVGIFTTNLQHCETTSGRRVFRDVWDEKMELSEQEYLNLLSHWNTAMDNPWRVLTKRAQDHNCNHAPAYLFTDASKKGYGYVLSDENGCVLMQGGHTWTGASMGWHIFIQEVAAALWSWKIVKDTLQQRPIILLVDNSAAAFAIRHGFSSNNIAVDLILNAVKNGASFREVRTITSAANPADELSRFKPLVDGKTRQAILGFPGAKNADTPWRNEFGLRHSEPDETAPDYNSDSDGGQTDGKITPDENVDEMQVAIDSICEDPANMEEIVYCTRGSDPKRVDRLRGMVSPALSS